jgi:MFS family permease
VQLARSTSCHFGFAGLVTAVYIVAGAVGQPLLGRLIDRFGQVVILAVSGILSFLAFTGMALTLDPLPGLAVALAAAAGLCTPPLEPALRALWPRLVTPGPQLKAAFSLGAGAQEIISSSARCSPSSASRSSARSATCCSPGGSDWSARSPSSSTRRRARPRLYGAPLSPAIPACARPSSFPLWRSIDPSPHEHEVGR